MPVRPSAKQSRELAEHAEWEWQFGQVAAFVRERGHCDLGNHPAAEWLRQQRLDAMLGHLSEGRRQRLTDIGIQLEEDDAQWQVTFERLERAVIRQSGSHQDAQPVRFKNDLDPDLLVWLDQQRLLWTAGRLGAERRQRLAPFDHLLVTGKQMALARHNDELWQQRFDRLLEFKQRFGHCRVPVKWEEDGDLARWVASQRHTAHRGRLPEERRLRLDEIGFIWNADADFRLPPFPAKRTPAANLQLLWERRYSEMKAFQQEHGHTNVSEAYDKKLSHWREVQREFRRKGKLSPERIARLDAIGFEWERAGLNGASVSESNQLRWDEFFTRLLIFRERHGHTRVPANWQEDPSLAYWVADQRKLERKLILRPDRKARLVEAGFEWRPKGWSPTRAVPPRAPSPKWIRLWEQRFTELTAFRETHGHTRVPNKRAEVAVLCKWCHTQRASRRSGTLSPERIARLDAIGFLWENPDQKGLSYQDWNQHLWDQQYTRLLAFRERFGHARVPVSWQEDPQLVTWVEKQRKASRDGRLSEHRRQRLDALGFIWKPDNSAVFRPRPDQTIPKPAHNATWDRHHAELCEYQKKHGTLKVSKSRDPKLYHWCGLQRKYHREGKLPAERKARLDAIGFDWGRAC